MGPRFVERIGSSVHVWDSLRWHDFSFRVVWRECNSIWWTVLRTGIRREAEAEREKRTGWLARVGMHLACKRSSSYTQSVWRDFEKKTRRQLEFQLTRTDRPIYIVSLYN